MLFSRTRPFSQTLLLCGWPRFRWLSPRPLFEGLAPGRRFFAGVLRHSCVGRVRLPGVCPGRFADYGVAPMCALFGDAPCFVRAGEARWLVRGHSAGARYIFRPSPAAVKGDGWAGCGHRDERRLSRAGRQGRGPPPLMPYRARGRSRRLTCRSGRLRAR